MSTIHPTAIISSEAQLASDVEVGPFAIVGAGVHLGAGCRVLAHAIIEGDTIVGENNTFGYGAVIGAVPQDYAFDPTKNKTGVRIGSSNTFREYVTIHRGTKDGTITTVGNECFLMANAHLGHNCTIGNNVILANAVLCAGHVTIGDRTVVGGGAGFHQFVRVGRCVMAQGLERFLKDVTPYTTANGIGELMGLNAIGLRRAGFSSEARMEIRRAYKLMFHSNLNVTQALEAAAKETWSTEAQEFFDFFHGSKRGFAPACSIMNNDE